MTLFLLAIGGLLLAEGGRRLFKSKARRGWWFVVASLPAFLLASFRPEISHERGVVVSGGGDYVGGDKVAGDKITVNQGSSDERVLGLLAQALAQHDKSLAATYPDGHTIFAITPNGIVRPPAPGPTPALGQPTPTDEQRVQVLDAQTGDVRINWATGGVIEMTPTQVHFVFPDMQLGSRRFINDGVYFDIYPLQRPVMVLSGGGHTAFVQTLAVGPGVVVVGVGITGT